ncbi:hypothetical protein V8F33_002039 [Rhypophila sp. PSN 637]
MSSNRPRQRTNIHINSYPHPRSSSNSYDEEFEESLVDDYSDSEDLGFQYPELDPNDSASTSQDYQPPPRSHSAPRRHKIPLARNSGGFYGPPAPIPPPMDADSDDYGWSGGRYAPPPPQTQAGFYGHRPGAPTHHAPPSHYPQSHVGGPFGQPPPHHYQQQTMVPYGMNPFAPSGGGFNEYGRGFGHEMAPYQGGPPAHYMPPGYGPGPGPLYHQPQQLYHPPPPPPTEHPAASTTPAPPPAPVEKKPDPEVEAMKMQLQQFKMEQQKKVEEEKQREREEEVRRRAQEEMERMYEQKRRMAEQMRIEQEKARAIADREARERLERERKEEEERRRKQQEELERVKREARDKYEAEQREKEERAKREAEERARLEAEAAAKIEAARREEREKLEKEAEARRIAEKKAAEEMEARKKREEEEKARQKEEFAMLLRIETEKLEAKRKAEEEAAAAAAKKAAEEAEWRKHLEEEAKIKAENDARAKLAKEAEDAAAAAAAAEQKKKDEEALKKRLMEEAKVKAEESNKKKEKAPIKFKDAVGRKFSFPFHLCQTWQGMEDLIKQAFLHVDVIGPHVQEGHYDLVGPNGEIILPTVWEKVIEPDWSVTMHMWPMDKTPPLRNQMPPGMHPGMGRGGPVQGPPGGHGQHRMGIPGMFMRPASARPGGAGPPGHGGGIPPPPPPPGWNGAGPMGGRPMVPPGTRPGPPAEVIDVAPGRPPRKQKANNPILGWVAGSKPSKSGKKYVGIAFSKKSSSSWFFPTPSPRRPPRSPSPPRSSYVTPRMMDRSGDYQMRRPRPPIASYYR